jgi:hypothetical protein
MDLNNLVKSQWDRVAAIGLTLIGALVLLIGWIGISDTAYLAEQAPYIISGGVGGVFFLGVGATLWISADLRDEWRKLDRIEDALRDGTLRWADNTTTTDTGRLAVDDELWTAAPSAPRRASNGSSVKTSVAASVSSEAPSVKVAAKPAARVARPRARAGVSHES